MQSTGIDSERCNKTWDISEFKDLVERIAKRRTINPLVSKEDTAQELFLKLQEMKNRGIFESCPTPKDRRYLAISCLGNKLKDIVSHNARRPDTSMYAYRDPQCEAFHAEVDRAVDMGSSSMGEGLIQFQNVADLMLHHKGGYKKDPRVEVFITECVQGYSKETWSKFEELQKKHKRYQSLDYIPPQTLASMCGMSRTEYYNMKYQLNDLAKDHDIGDFVK